jgi:hypothetical protein
MAVFPCDWTSHRYAEPQRSVYVTYVFGTDAETCKLRLCPRHFAECMHVIHEHFAMVGDDSAISQTCSSCGEDRVYAVYCKVFDLRDEPVYWATDLCSKCWNALSGLLRVENGHAMPSPGPVYN